MRQQALNRAQRVRKQTSDPDGMLRGLEGSCTSNDNTPRKKQKQFSDDSSTENSLLEAPESSQPEPAQQLSEIELVFKPHPKDGGDGSEEARYIKTTANATGNATGCSINFSCLLASTARTFITWYAFARMVGSMLLLCG